MPKTDGQIAALGALISNATKVVEGHYARSAKPYVPSLEDTEEHPLDRSLDPELREAVQIIEGACAQLCATLARPSHTVVNKLMSLYESTCLGIAMKFGIPDVLQEDAAGMHITDIAERTGLEERKIGRILRLLATKHVFREVSENVFANNRLSLQLLAENPLSSLGLHFAEDCHPPTTVLAEVLGDEAWGHSYSARETAFNKWSSFAGSLGAFVATPQGTNLATRFGIGMIGWAEASQAQNVIYDYPWKELGKDATVCDLGGGVGYMALELAKEYPFLRLKLQDLWRTLEQARTQVWPERCPEAIREGRIEFKAIDFFKESPIPGCSVYYMKNIIHDWPDHDCVTILSNIRKVMKPYSRVLIHEYILQQANRVPDDQADSKQAPEPLLPNYGVGRIRQYNLDLDMLTMLNSEERRLRDFIRLGERAGLRFKKLWDMGELGLVEFRLPLPSVHN
ncbi:hypothetical protein NLJ89_g7832 [Agrocybe chaxingu]|uniref:O-methyltransferase domain-containing protein n=1 Tax=Agrocybe chaxingu TaxID=84603 RepID=A0A9W8JVW2_9AGAR|nr:hypothetical protein NLJ89_g7832 [Agrocybe chaxingu]